MSELSPRARAFLDAHRRDGTPTPADADRVRAALAPKLGPPPRSFPWVKAGLVATAGLALVLGARLLPARPAAEAPPSAPPAVALSSPPAAPAPAPTPTEVPAVEPKPEVTPPPPASKPKPSVPSRSHKEAPTPVAPTAEPEPAPAVEVAPEPPVEPVVEPPPPVARPDELTLVSEAEDQLRRGQPGGALELLTRWESHFGEGRGQFEQEARAARVVALCQSGDLDSGRTEARAYFVKFPKALARNRIERACTRSTTTENH